MCASECKSCLVPYGRVFGCRLVIVKWVQVVRQVSASCEASGCKLVRVRSLCKLVRVRDGGGCGSCCSCASLPEDRRGETYSRVRGFVETSGDLVRRDQGRPTLMTRGDLKRGVITSKEKYSANNTKPTALYMYIITNARTAVCRHDAENYKTSHVSA